jgi:transposase
MARKRRLFTKEFKVEAVKLVKTSGRTVGQVAKELDLTETALRAWVQQAKVDAGDGPEAALTTAEKQELAALRRENRVLRMERDLLRKAAVSSAGQRNGNMLDAPDGTNRASWAVGKGEAGTLGKVETRAVPE